jgi:hypothetical protein
VFGTQRLQHVLNDRSGQFPRANHISGLPDAVGEASSGDQGVPVVGAEHSCHVLNHRSEQFTNPHEITAGHAGPVGEHVTQGQADGLVAAEMLDDGSDVGLQALPRGESHLGAWPPWAGSVEKECGSIDPRTVVVACDELVGGDGLHEPVHGHRPSGTAAAQQPEGNQLDDGLVPVQLIDQ